jgi:hypothetical protein
MFVDATIDVIIFFPFLLIPSSEDERIWINWSWGSSKLDGWLLGELLVGEFVGWLLGELVSAEYLYPPLYLVVPPYNRIQLPKRGAFCEVDSKLVPRIVVIDVPCQKGWRRPGGG